MAAGLVQLPNPHANRYTAADREAAYQAWRFASGRSLRKTAELTGIAHGTLGNWSKEGGWQGRARGEDAAEAESLRGALAALAATEAAKSIRVAASLRDDETGKTPPKVRLDAAVWLAGVAGVVPAKQGLDLAGALRPAPAPFAEEEDGDRARTPAELEEELRRLWSDPRQGAA